MITLNGEKFIYKKYCAECGKHIRTKEYDIAYLKCGISYLKYFPKILRANYCSSKCKAVHTDKEWFMNNEYEKQVLDNIDIIDDDTQPEITNYLELEEIAEEQRCGY